jgi:hypothetical protein
MAGGVDKRYSSPARSRTRADDLLVRPTASCMMSWTSARLGDDLVVERLSSALNRTRGASVLRRLPPSDRRERSLDSNIALTVLWQYRAYVATL